MRVTGLPIVDTQLAPRRQRRQVGAKAADEDLAPLRLCYGPTPPVFSRLLPLLLALCTLLPAPLRARMVEACRERDECCCRKAEAKTPTGPTVRRVDCCEAPCAVEHTTASVTIPPRTDVGDGTALAVVSASIDVAVRLAVAVPAPPGRGRDPPLRIHAMAQRWLL